MAPPRSVRHRRFSIPHDALGPRLRSALRALPLGVPLAAGMLCAGLIDAAVSEPAHARGEQPAAGVASAPVGDPPPDLGRADNEPAEAAADDHDVLAGPLPAAAEASSAARALTTRDAALEARIDRLLVDGKTPYGAVVVMDAHTSRVVAVAEHSTRGPSDGLALRPLAPAASVFKVVTASALLAAGVDADDDACFHGGRTRMTARLLKDDPRRDRCIPFADVLPKSANVAIAKLASRKLTPTSLRAEAARWGFGVRFADVSGLVPSSAVIPDEPFAFAEAAAGFGDVKISALHGAVIASVVANDGVLVRPVFDAGVEPDAPVRVIATRHARALKKMLTETVTDGTARRAFRQGPRLPVSAAGKTGSLTDYETGLDTSWFVGFAPAEAPQFIVSALVVNTARWHIKASWLAKEALRLTVEQRGAAQARSRVASR
ncbi:MAG: penicillin-binding protein [Deltaproteobacteria bacterium]|nr:penicillin-binding protein [Deltaproteobacteria bacterium]